MPARVRLRGQSARMRRQPGASARRRQRQAERAQLAQALQATRYRVRGHVHRHSVSPVSRLMSS